MPNVPKRNRDFPAYFPVILLRPVPNVPKRNRDDIIHIDISFLFQVPNVPKRNRDPLALYQMAIVTWCLMYLRGIETLNRFHVTHDLFSCA